MFCNPTLGICNLVVENIQIVVVCQKERHDRGHVFLFGFRRPGAAPPFGIRMLRAAKPPFRRGFACGKTLERRKSGAAQKGRRTRFKTADSKF